MISNPSRRRPRLRSPLLAVAVLAVVVGLPTVVLPVPTASAEEPYATIEVTPNQNLIDGQTINVTMRANPGYSFAPKGQVRICRDGVAYTKSEDLQPAQGNCPSAPLSSSGTTTPNIFAYPNGSVAITSLQVGVGTVVWGPTSAEPTLFSLTCDPTHPCRLVVDITDQRGLRRIIDSSTLLTFSTETATGSCGGTEADVISTGGSDRMDRAWIELTKAKCVAQPGTKASTKGIFAGEGEGHASFASGASDMIYSGVGPTFPSGTPTRPSVSVPVALNATVIGVLGGYPKFADDWPLDIPRPFENLQATWPELASLFGSEPFLFTIKYEDALKQRNPELAISPVFNTNKSVPLAPAGAESVTWFATQAFDTLAGSEWVSPPNPVSGNTPNTPRGVHESFATAQPPFAVSYIELYSGQSQVKKVAANQFLPQTYGPIWILTDLATARELGIPTVAIPNSSGQFVQPTDESLLAAVPDLQLQADGTYLPAASSGAAGAAVTSSSPDAYPLTFVEHAVVPTEPLVDSACVARTGSEQVMKDWLAFITGPGQASLPDGLVALPQAMAEQATRAQSLVGTAALTGPCAPAPPVTPEGTPAPPTGGDLPSSDLPDFSLPASLPGGAGSPGGATRSSIGAGSTGGIGADLGTGGTGGPAEGGTGEDDVTLAEIAYPGPTGGGSSNGLATGLALVVLAILAAVGGMLSSGRRRSLPRRDRS